MVYIYSWTTTHVLPVCSETSQASVTQINLTEGKYRLHFIVPLPVDNELYAVLLLVVVRSCSLDGDKSGKQLIRCKLAVQPRSHCCPQLQQQKQKQNTADTFQAQITLHLIRHGFDHNYFGQVSHGPSISRSVT